MWAQYILAKGNTGNMQLRGIISLRYANISGFAYYIAMMFVAEEVMYKLKSL